MALLTAVTNEQRAAARVVLARVAYLLYDRRLTELQGGNMSMRLAACRQAGAASRVGVVADKAPAPCTGLCGPRFVARKPIRQFP